jgi:O-acetyl-ADP-ribose deacetylase (regulator of RNase III)
MKILQGDLIALALAGRFDVIVHRCNCDGDMGAGIARAIRAHFPEAYKVDAATLPGDASKLGTYPFACCIRGDSKIAVINAYTQLHPSGLGVLVDYEAVRRTMHALKHNFPGKRIGYPKIGAGLARGDWNIISQIINEELAGEDHTLVESVAS